MFENLRENVSRWWAQVPRWPRRNSAKTTVEPELERVYPAQNGETWQHLVEQLHWDQPQAEAHLATQARIVIFGLPGSGKSTLLNSWCGWEVSTGPSGEEPAEQIEDFGLFCLLDLPPTPPAESGFIFQPSYEAGFGAADAPGAEWGIGPMPGLDLADPLIWAEGADVILYLIDSAVGVQPADFRWVGRLRQVGLPLLVILNKCDLLKGNFGRFKAETESRLAAAVWPISARQDQETLDRLLREMMKISPKLTVALGRAFPRLRPWAAQRLTQQAAWVNGLVACQPIPLVDIPIQLGIIKDLILKIGSVYDRPAEAVQRREVMTAMVGGLLARFGIQQAVKLVPVAGWLVSGVLGWSYTWLFGQAAAAYFHTNSDQKLQASLRPAARVIDPLRTLGTSSRRALGRTAESLRRVWQHRPRFKVEWPKGK